MIKRPVRTNIPEGYTSVPLQGIRNYFSNLALCESEQKKKFLSKEKKYFRILFFLYAGIYTVLFVIVQLSYLQAGANYIFSFIIFVIPVIVLYLFILQNKSIRFIQSGDLYSCKVNIYDKQEMVFTWKERFYFVRVSDQNNYALNYWIPVSYDVFCDPTNLTLYYCEKGQKQEVYIQKD